MKKAPKIPEILTLEESLRLKAADLTLREAKLLYRYHRNVRVTRAGINQLIQQLKRERLEPPELFHHFRRSTQRLEDQANAALEIYADTHVPTRWMQAVGLGYSQTVGIYTMIDIDRAPTISALWRYAGYDPTVVRLTKKEAGECVRFFEEKYKTKHPDEATIRAIAIDLNRGQEQLLRITRIPTRRVTTTWIGVYKAILSYPWNQELKEILFRVGLVFRRGGLRSERTPYRSIYDWRKAYEQERNERGDYADQAAYRLSSRNFRKGTTTYQAYTEGKLPPLHIDARARRFTVKIFLVHLYQVLYYERHGKMPKKPYVLDVLGKGHDIACPKWPFRGGGDPDEGEE